MHNIIFSFFLLAVVVPLLLSCNNSSGSDHYFEDGDTILFKYATNLQLINYGNYYKALFRNPWDTAKILRTYILAYEEKNMPTNLPLGTKIRIPLERSVVYTSVHASLIEEIGRLDAIKGACDSKYMHKPSIRQKLESGIIADCGSSRMPNLEKILLLDPDAILLSAFENSNDHNKVDQLGIPIIDCIDYMETSPLARAEWMKFFGVLFGCKEKTDSMFSEIESAYLNIKNKVGEIGHRPMVLTDLIYGQAWNVPGAFSTIGVLIEDAGGTNPFAKYKMSGSVRLSPEEVLYNAQEAEIWLIKYSQNLPPSLAQMGFDNPLYTKFRAFKETNIYGCNSEKSSYFEDAAFHPHWILAEYVDLIHPELGGMVDNHNYYSKIQPTNK